MYTKRDGNWVIMHCERIWNTYDEDMRRSTMEKGHLAKDLETRDPSAWLKAIRGPKRGRVIGVARTNPSLFIGASKDQVEASTFMPPLFENPEMQELRNRM